MALNALDSWSHLTGFTFSPTKTVCIHICCRHHCPKLSVNLSLRNTLIRCVDSYKYLGLIIDNSLTWRPHIQQLRKSCTKTLHLLKCLSHKHWGADRTSLLRPYTVLLKSKIDYGVEVYYPTAQTVSSLLLCRTFSLTARLTLTSGPNIFAMALTAYYIVTQWPLLPTISSLNGPYCLLYRHSMALTAYYIVTQWPLLPTISSLNGPYCLLYRHSMALCTDFLPRSI